MSVVITILVIITILIGIGQTIDNYKKNQEAARKQAEQERKLAEMRNAPDTLVEVSLAQLVAHPNTYKYDYTYNKKIIVITDQMVVLSNYTNTKELTLCPSTGNGRRDWRSSPCIKVDYRNMDSMEKLVMLNNLEKIRVTGRVFVNRYGDISIRPTNLEWQKWNS